MRQNAIAHPVKEAADEVKGNRIRQPMALNYDLRAALLQLPKKAIKLREFKTKYTTNKREVYVISNECEYTMNVA
ncbi:31672_t:CDS:2, partial [Gigaspora margarita]